MLFYNVQQIRTYISRVHDPKFVDNSLSVCAIISVTISPVVFYQNHKSKIAQSFAWMNGFVSVLLHAQDNSIHSQRE